jgi:hypothetical protein
MSDRWLWRNWFFWSLKTVLYPCLFGTEWRLLLVSKTVETPGEAPLLIVVTEAGVASISRREASLTSSASFSICSTYGYYSN